jgi:hypothetical protein
MPVRRSARWTAARPVQFVVYGDMPYGVTMPDGRSDTQVLADDIAPAIRHREDIPFVIHVGDLGRPEDVCTDAQLESFKTFWATAFRQPVFYTPGDNDWTDCDRPQVPVPTSELARLAAVRRMFFSQPPVRDPSWHYATQPDQPENARWWYAGVLFVTVHMVGKAPPASHCALRQATQGSLGSRGCQGSIEIPRAVQLRQTVVHRLDTASIRAKPTTGSPRRALYDILCSVYRRACLTTHLWASRRVVVTSVRRALVGMGHRVSGGKLACRPVAAPPADIV